MKISTILFCVRPDEVLLALKDRGFGAGKWNGFGGKREVGEEIRTTAVREAHQESGLIIDESHLKQVAVIDFFFDATHVFQCHVFVANIWQGEPVTSEEMRQPTWFSLNAIPYNQMWVSDSTWMPLVLEQGKTITAQFHYDQEGNVVKYFTFTEVNFL